MADLPLRPEGCPERPVSDDPTVIGFHKRPMVSWFAPKEMLSTGMRLVLASIFGSYADRRELQAALADPHVADYSNREEMWLDYIADTGDGFDSTYTMAYLLAKDEIVLERKGEHHPTKRGDVLVLGGDQVYPDASREHYRDRFLGPFRAALPYTPPPDHPHLFALPGNHDWYDGLTAFLRVFCQRLWVGGWRTQQNRSYFALRLPKGWWLWGIDIQLDGYIDGPQLDFFRDVGTRVIQGDSIVLCTAKPAWVRPEIAGDEWYKGDLLNEDNLQFFERAIIPAHARLALTLTGDLHHYARYRDLDDKRHKITVGGGGAYLYPTHTLPESVQWREGDAMATYEVQKLFPEAPSSRRKRWGALLLPIRNPAFWWLPAALYLLVAWNIEAAVRNRTGALASAMANATPGPILDSLSREPGGVFALAVVVGALVAFADARGLRRIALGAIHTFAHLVTVIGLTMIASDIVASAGIDGIAFGAATLTIVAGTGGVVGGLVFGLYLTLSHVLAGRHPNEVFACQRIPHYKCFVRLHIDRSGDLHLFPIGVRDVPGGWQLSTEAAFDAPWFEPGATKPAPELIEDPLRLKRSV